MITVSLGRILEKTLLVRIAILVGTSCFVLFAIWFAWPKHNGDDAGASTSVLQAITNFTPYMFRVLDGFRVGDAGFSYSHGILLFQLHNQQQTIAVTEQVLPSAVADNIDPNATKVEGVDGTGIITYNATQTTAALLTKEHRGIRTMVLLNTNSPLPQSTFEDLLRGLRPITP